jgi:SAM-dependent methyltransferase
MGVDIGYTWPWTHGHLVVVAAAAALLVLAWRFRWHWAAKAAVGLVLAWAVAAFLVVQLLFRFNDVPRLPTQAFLPTGAGRVLDLGAGSGRSSIMVLWERPKATLVALDNFTADYIRGHGLQKTESNLRAAGVEGRAVVQTGDMRTLPFPDQSFDAVLSAYAVDHLDREGQRRTLDEAARVLKPRGQVLIQVMCPDGWTRFAFGPLMLHGARAEPMRARWRSALERAGFEVLETGTEPLSLYLLGVKGGRAQAPG